MSPQGRGVEDSCLRTHGGCEEDSWGRIKRKGLLLLSLSSSRSSSSSSVVGTGHICQDPKTSSVTSDELGVAQISSSAMLCEALPTPANLAKPCYPPCETGQERSTRGADGPETAQNARRTPNEAIKRTPKVR